MEDPNVIPFLPQERKRPKRIGTAWIDLPAMPDTIDGRNVYERLPGEPATAFAAFRIYRDLGPTRHCRKVNSEEAHWAYSTLCEWRRKYRWEERALYYDNEMDSVRLEETKKQIKLMVERHLSIASVVQSTAFKKLREEGENMKMNPETILKYLVEGVKLERGSRGEATETIRVTDKEPAQNEKPAHIQQEEEDQVREELRRRIEAIAHRKDEQAKRESEPVVAATAPASRIAPSMFSEN